MGKLRDRHAFEPLVRMLHEQDDDIACAAAEALGDLGDRRAVEPLINRLQNPVPGSARRFAAIALGKLRDSRALTPLLVALTDNEADVRCAAAEGLGHLGDARALPQLQVASMHDEGYDLLGSVRDFALEAIDRIKTGSGSGA